MYRKLCKPPRLVVIADSAYQSNAELTDCLALRGWLICQTCDTEDGKDCFPGGIMQVIDYSSRKLQVISRSAFAAELKNTWEATNKAIHYVLLLYEICFGGMTANECTRMRDNASYSKYIKIHVLGDSKGVYTAVTKEDPNREPIRLCVIMSKP